MKIYWSYRSLPEVLRLPKEQRLIAWRAAYRDGLKRWETKLAFMTWLAMPIIWTVLNWFLMLPSWIFQSVNVALIGVGGGFFGQVCTLMARERLRSSRSEP